MFPCMFMFVFITLLNGYIVPNFTISMNHNGFNFYGTFIFPSVYTLQAVLGCVPLQPGTALPPVMIISLGSISKHMGWTGMHGSQTVEAVPPYLRKGCASWPWTWLLWECPFLFVKLILDLWAQKKNGAWLCSVCCCPKCGILKDKQWLSKIERGETSWTWMLNELCGPCKNETSSSHVWSPTWWARCRVSALSPCTFNLHSNALRWRLCSPVE